MKFDAFNKAHELKEKILFTLFILLLFRLGSYITVPGINVSVFEELAKANSAGLLGIFNTLSGGSLSRMSIFALSIVPYITASIVMQLVSMSFQSMIELKKEGEFGRIKIAQYTRYLTIALSTFQGYGVAVAIEKASGSYGSLIAIDLELFKVSTVTALVGGTMLLMWLGEQITMNGIGNGTSMIIFTGIASGLPQAFISLFGLARSGKISILMLLLIVASVIGLILLIVFVERAYRKIPVQYPRRQIGNKIFGGDTTHLPLKVNIAGVVPPIFASSILAFPATLLSFMPASKEDGSLIATILRSISRGEPLYLTIYTALIVLFCFVYTSAIFNTTDTADVLKRNQGFISGLRPGASTATYLDKIVNRLTLLGALYITFVCVVPEYGFSRYNIPFYLAGSSFLIVVNVVMETFAQVQAILFSQQYESLIKKARLKTK